MPEELQKKEDEYPALIDDKVSKITQLLLAGGGFIIRYGKAALLNNCEAVGEQA